eukprot:7444699-Lingulodinium_polyedra.AAC.1
MSPWTPATRLGSENPKAAEVSALRALGLGLHVARCVGHCVRQWHVAHNLHRTSWTARPALQ